MAEVSEKDLFQRVDLSHTADREKIASPSLNFLQDSWRRLTKNKGAVFSLVIVLAIILLAILAPVIAPFDPLEQNAQFANLPARIPGLFSGLRNGVDVYAQQGVPEGVNFYFGTDNLGRDIFSRLLLGTFYSIFIAFSAILLAGIIGSILGAIAGYFGGYIDELFLFISEIFMSIPVILITLGIIVLLNNGFHSIILALFVLYMPRTLNYVRGLVKQEKHKNYIKIARIYGVSNFRIMRRHIAPNIILPILVNFSTNFAGAILTEASLGYLGFGIQPPYPTLGNMLNESQSYFLLAPWFTILPGLMILFLVYKINQISRKYQEKK